MSLQYFIDAYNVIRSNDAMSAGPLQAQRERLLRFIDEKRPCGNNEAIVVFDGKSGRDWNGWPGATRVIFSLERDADTEIKERVDAMSNRASAVVVTNDRAIQKWVSGAGARVMSCADFLRAGIKTGRPAGSGKPDAATAAEINEQMKRIWKIN